MRLQGGTLNNRQGSATVHVVISTRHDGLSTITRGPFKTVDFRCSVPVGVTD